MSIDDGRSSHELKSSIVLDAARRAANYITESDQRPVAPTADSIADLQRFTTMLPEGGTDAADVVALLDEVGSPATVVSTRGRYFGYVNGGTDPAAAGAAILAGAWDQNVALPAMSPVAAHLDNIAAQWTCDLLNLPRSAVATFCAGASIANLTCVLAARDALLHQLDWSVDSEGLTGAPPLRVVASEEIHVSVLKALRAAGIGTSQITYAPVDDRGAVITSKVPKLDDHTLVLLQAGNVNTGHSDPFREIIPAARDRGSWVHVDGAFGLWAAASPSQRHLVEGVDMADSWATDAHKWLNAPYDSGIAIVRDEQHLRRSLAFDAAYLSTDSDRALAHLGLQMSQRARGVEAWAIYAHRGRRGVADLVDKLSERAEQMAAMLKASGVELLVEPALNQVLVALGSDVATDAAIAAVQLDGTCWVGGTTWQGRRAMRISICDTSTTPTDIDKSAAAIIRCSAST